MRHKGAAALNLRFQSCDLVFLHHAKGKFAKYFYLFILFIFLFFFMAPMLHEKDSHTSDLPDVSFLTVN